MTVRMRSQDAWYGMGNDIPCFSFIHEMMWLSLKERYPELEYGIYHHSVDSFHIYQKHYEGLKQIIEGSEYIRVYCPMIKDKTEVDFLKKVDFSTIPKRYNFSNWLNQ